MWLVSACVLLAATAAVLDWRRGEIPNWLTLPPLLAAPVVYFALHGAQGLLFSVAGALFAGLVPYVLFRIEAMGGGDVKLLAALGALVGPGAGVEIVVVGLLAGCAQALIVLARRRRLKAVLASSLAIFANALRPARARRPLPTEALTEMRLGPAIFVAVLAVLFSRG
jgi:prepilin peptidase CpaA